MNLFVFADNIKKYFMLDLVNFISLVNIHPFLTFRPATHLKKRLEQEQIRACNQVNWLKKDAV